jgi:hypothetical protein
MRRLGELGAPVCPGDAEPACPDSDGIQLILDLVVVRSSKEIFGR